jgi:ribonuclease HI
LFLEKVEESWSTYQKIFTDGSKLQNGKCGSAFYIPESEIEGTFQMPTDASVFTAECVAIREALLFVISSTVKNSVIFTDSLSIISSLSSTSNVRTNDHILTDIRKMLYLISVQGVEVCLVWIPSHSGIKDNDRVDDLAKRACDCGIIPNSFAFPLPDCVNVLKNQVKEEWNSAFLESPKGSHYKAIQTCVPSAPWFQHIPMSKHHISLLCRARIGHCIIAAHLFKIKILSSPLCECGEEDETLDHIFFNCSLLPNVEFIESIKEEIVTLPVNIMSLLSLNSRRINKCIISHLCKNNKNI